MTKIEKIADKLGQKVILGESISKHTVLKVGGPAQIFYQADTKAELIKAVTIAQEVGLPYLVLGMGANVLISDSGFSGLVIKNRASQIAVVGKKGKIKKGEKFNQEVFIEAESGSTLVQLCRFTFDEGLTGLEFLYAIPGTIGGAVKINAHGQPAKGEFIGNLVWGATLLTPKSEIKKVNQQYFDFAYDYSKIIQTGEIVISVVFKLEVGRKEEVWKKALEYFAARKLAQPYDLPSAGCFFQNLKASDAARLGLSDGIYSTGTLISAAGLAGIVIGGAKISEKHGNFFLNLGNAKAKDFIQLIDLVKKRIKEKFGVNLKEEIFLIGFN